MKIATSCLSLLLLFSQSYNAVSEASKSAPLFLRKRGLATVDNVIRFELINTVTNRPVANLTDGSVINFQSLGMTAPSFNINAVVSKLTSVKIGSVKFGFGNNSSFRIETAPPFAFCGDNSGKFNYCTELTNFTKYKIIATAFSNGSPGTPLSVNFEIKASAQLAPQPNIFAPTAPVVTPTAPVVAPTALIATAPPVVPTTAPVTPPTAPVAPLAAPVAAPTAPVAPSTAPVATNAAINGFELFSTNNPQAKIMKLQNGMVIDVSTIPGMSNPAFNINALVTGPVKSILFGYNGFSSFHTETSAPYSFCGDVSGIYNPCSQLVVGNYTVTATPTSTSGVVGQPYSVSFTIISPNAPTALATTAPAPSPPTVPTTTGYGPIDSNGGRWITVNANASITARHEACFVFAGRKAYLIGGRGSKPTNIYDPVTRTWTVGAQPPIQLHHMQCVAVDGKIWAVAPWTSWFPYEQTTNYAYVYDPATDSWSTRTALPISRRRGSTAAIVVGRRIYVSHGNIGGHETNDNHATSYGWLDSYDVDTDSWTTNLPDAPTPRDHAGGSLIGNNTICVTGGRNGGEPNWPDLAPTDCFDLTTNTWSVQANISQMRGGSSYGTSCDGKLLIAGGEGFGKAWQNVDIFDGQNWTSMAPMVQGRHGVGLAVDCQCQQIYIASGAGAQGDGPELYSVETYFFGGSDVPCLA